jgi:hypothetical protein
MIRTRILNSARAETFGRRTRKIVAGAFALATMLLPFGAWGMDGSPKLTMDTAGNLLPLPPIPYLDSMRWMNWKPSAPIFKVDTLLIPDRAQPGFFRMPTEYERGFPRVS